MKAHLVDILDKIGGQCAELYPEKPIYDIPGVPYTTAQGLVDALMAQNQAVRRDIPPAGDGGKDREKSGDPLFASLLTRARNRGQGDCDRGRRRLVPAKRPPIPGIEAFEEKSVFYAVRKMEAFRGKRILIVGGGDSALDWTLNLAPVASHLTLLHRRDQFRAAPDSVNKMMALVGEGRIDFVLGQVSALEGRAAKSRPRWSRPMTARIFRSPATRCCRSSD